MTGWSALDRFLRTDPGRGLRPPPPAAAAV